jgi:septum formation protein
MQRHAARDPILSTPPEALVSKSSNRVRATAGSSPRSEAPSLAKDRLSIRLDHDSSRHKGRMILFSAFEVKAPIRQIQSFAVFFHLATIRAPLCTRSMPQPPLILASTSPFRRELLARLGLPFETANPAVDEALLRAKPRSRRPAPFGSQGPRCRRLQHPDALIIGSDQVACLDGQIFGKPGTHDSALRQLQVMRGHRVKLLHRSVPSERKNRQSTSARCSDAGHFQKPAPTRKSKATCARNKPYHCAGSAKSEGLGIALIARIDGEDPNALIGLPLIALCDLLRIENVSVF